MHRHLKLAMLFSEAITRGPGKSNQGRTGTGQWKQCNDLYPVVQQGSFAFWFDMTNVPCSTARFIRLLV